MDPSSDDFKAGYLAGERDGKAVGYWEGYAEALKDAGIGDENAEQIEVTSRKEREDN